MQQAFLHHYFFNQETIIQPHNYTIITLIFATKIYCVQQKLSNQNGEIKWSNTLHDQSSYQIW